MDEDQLSFAGATGLSQGRSSLQEGLAKILEFLVDAPFGAAGLPINDSAISRLTELLGAGVPVVGGLKALKAAKGAQAVKQPIKAYHGSPHDFDKFSMEKIGTGEGAQAYGHGLYFAENPAVAEEYARRVGTHGVATSDEALARYFEPGRIVPGYGGRDKVIAFHPTTTDRAWSVTVQRVDDSGTPIERPRTHMTAPSLADVRKALTPNRQGMYEVNIHADPEDFLDWDAPLSQQRPEVQAKVAQARGAKDVRPVRLNDGSYSVTTVQPDGSGRIIWDVKTETPEQAMDSYRRYVDESHGQEVYHDMGRGQMGRVSEQPEATRLLKEAGIPGIKYYDQGSRAAGQGTRNYVVFDDKLIDIVKKYGWAGAAIMLLGNQLQPQPPQGPQ